MFKQKKRPAKDYSYMGLAQLKRLQSELDARDAVHRLNKIHHENIQRQINNNHSTEYTRIRNYLDSSMPPGTRNNHHLRKRLDELGSMLQW